MCCHRQQHTNLRVIFQRISPLFGQSFLLLTYPLSLPFMSTTPSLSDSQQDSVLVRLLPCPRQPCLSPRPIRATSSAPVSVVPTAPSPSPSPCRVRSPSLLPSGLFAIQTRSWQAAAAAAGIPQAATNYVFFDVSSPLCHPLPNGQPLHRPATVTRLLRRPLTRLLVTGRPACSPC